MYTENFDMPALFAQLGLDNSEAAIEDFIARHRLPDAVALSKAGFWNPAQARFLAEEMQRDAGWALVIDALSVRLRHHGQSQK